MAEPAAAEVASERDVLLATKLHVPRPGPGVVPRPRLTGHLDGGLEQGLVLVCAPAGYGKTVLLADWARRRQRPVAWLSLDEGDNDPARFWRHAVAALDRARPGISERAGPLLGPPTPPSFAGLVTALINELAAQPEDEAVLVLDDYHAIGSQPVHASLEFLLEHRPPELRLVLASRADPPLALARLRARGELAELRAAELRFTAEEAAALLRQLVAGADASLPDADVAALTARTEGWAAGLQLAGLSLRGQADTTGFVADFTGSHRYVLDFLTQEVLECQPEQVRAFLLETSVLERLSGPLCDAVTGRCGSQDLLEQVERAGLFLVPLDEVRGWWRFHHLFADLLRACLRAEQPAQVTQLHRNAAAWHEEHGLTEEAIRHAVAAGEMTWAARLIERQFDTVSGLRGEGVTVQRWLDALPADLVRSRPRLLLAQAQLAAATGRVETVERLVEAAERAHAGAAEEPFEPPAGRAASLLVNIPALIAVHRSLLAWLRGDAEATAEYASQALAELSEGERLLDYVARFNLGIADWLRGRLTDAERVFVPSIAGWAHTPTITIWGRHILGQVQRAQGHLDAAALACRLALETTAPPGRPPLPAAGPAYVGLAEVAYQRNELDAALRHVTDGIALCRQLAYTPPLAAGLVTLAWIRQLTGDPAGALEAIGEAAQAAPGPPGLLNPVPAQRGRLLLAQGDLAAAARFAQDNGLGPGRPVGLPARTGLPTAGPGPARTRPAWPGPGAAGPAGRGRRRPGPDGQPDRDRRAAGTRADRQRAGNRRGQRPGGCADPGLPAGLRAGLRRRGAADGRPARPADRGPARRAGRRRSPVRLPGPAQARVRRRTSHTGRGEAHPSAARPGRPADRPRAGSPRDAGGGRPNQAIADQLVVTLDTVKKHVGHVLGKLGAANRTEAVARARELRLIP